MTTPRQRAVLKAIDELTGKMGFPPTTRELADELGVWNSSMHKTLLRLREQGLVTWEPNRARTLAVKDLSGQSPTQRDQSA